MLLGGGLFFQQRRSKLKIPALDHMGESMAGLASGAVVGTIQEQVRAMAGPPLLRRTERLEERTSSDDVQADLRR